MSSTKNYNKLSLIALCAAVSLSYGCADDDWRGSGLNSDRITYALVAESAQNQSRSGVIGQDVIPMLTENGTDTLFLHPTISDMPAPGVVQNNSSRGVPVENENFATVIKEFGVEAYTSGDNRAYIKYGKVDSHNGNNIWTQSTASHYWPEYDLDFYAVAPYSLHETNPISFDLTNKTMSFTYSTPKSTDGLQDATVQPDIMLAYAGDVNQDTQNGQVPTQFWHALAGIRFKVSDVAGGTVKSIKLNNIHGAGSVVFDCATETYKWTTSDQATNSYTQTFDVEVQDVIPGKTTDASGNVLGNQDITNVNPVTTFMMIPQALNANAEIEVVINAIAPGETTPRDITLSAKINANGLKSWEAGKIYTYTISTESINWTYVFEVQSLHGNDSIKEPYTSEHTGYQVKSYRFRTNNPSVQEILPWSASSTGATDEIQMDGVDPATPFAQWLPGAALSGCWGEGSFEFIPIETAMKSTTFVTDCIGDEILRSRADRGTYMEPFDLSRHAIDGSDNPPTVAQSTANCYVVGAAGRYKLPLIYGNAIKNGATNTKAYTYSNGTKDTYALPVMIRHDGKSITKPQIDGATDACLIWSDAYKLIHEVELIDNELQFSINRDFLQQGNAIVAVRNSSGQILWSWHIWVTELELSNASTLTPLDQFNGANNNNRYQLACANLGWCDAKVTYYTGRTGIINFTQDISGKVIPFQVTQETHTQATSYGNNTYYQHGRKDPIIGCMDLSNTTKPQYYQYPNLYTYKMEQNRVALQDGITKPHVLFVAGVLWIAGNGRGADWNWGLGGEWSPYRNLWNNVKLPTGKTNLYDDKNNRNNVIKTVYDPSPVGYVVPPRDAFRVMSTKTDGLSGTLNGKYELVNGKHQYTIYTTKTKSHSVKFEPTGQRWYAQKCWAGNPGDLYNPENLFLWTADQCNEEDYYYEENTGIKQREFGFSLSATTGNTCDPLYAGASAMARPVRPIKEMN